MPVVVGALAANPEIYLTGLGCKREEVHDVWERALAMWSRLEPFVKYVRKRPGRQNYAIYFEELAEHAARRINYRN